MERETTSIKINKKLWKEAKIRAIKKDMGIGEFIENLIQKELEKQEKKT